MDGGGGTNGFFDEVGVGALVFEWALAFLDVAFLDDIVANFAHFLPKFVVVNNGLRLEKRHALARVSTKMTFQEGTEPGGIPTHTPMLKSMI